MPDRPDPTDPFVPAASTGPAASTERSEPSASSEPTLPAPDPGSGPRPTRLTPAVGVLLLAVAGTSLLDDADLATVRWWFPFAVAALVAALAVVALTVRRLLAPGITIAPVGGDVVSGSGPGRPGPG